MFYVKTAKASALMLALIMLIALIPSVNMAEGNIIPEITIKIVVPPVDGAKPVFTCDFTDSSYGCNYTVDHIDWYNPFFSMNYDRNLVFDASEDCHFQVMLIASGDWHFDKNETHITVDGKAPDDVIIQENRIYITRDYEVLTAIDEVNALIDNFYSDYNVSNVTVTSAEPDKYSIKSFEISDDTGFSCSPDDILVEGRLYGIKVEYTPAPGYGFTENTQTLNNGVPTWQYGREYLSPFLISSLNYSEPDVKNRISEVKLTVPIPVKGNKPADAMAPYNAEGYTVSSTAWTPVCTEFKGGTVYTVTVVLLADKNYKFSYKTAYFINGRKAAIIKNYWGKATIAFTFAATQADETPMPTAVPEEPTKEPGGMEADSAEPTVKPTAEPLKPTEAPAVTPVPEEPNAEPTAMVEETAAPHSSDEMASEALIIVLAVIGGLLFIALVTLMVVLLVRKKG